jgi:hypothetical protein
MTKRCDGVMVLTLDGLAGSTDHGSANHKHVEPRSTASRAVTRGA